MTSGPAPSVRDALRPARSAIRLSPTELAYGLACGFGPLEDGSADPVPRHQQWQRRRGRSSARSATDAVLRDALNKAPCLISFSGGRDSSALLAAATTIARREGLPLPIPATLVFPGDAETDEAQWQRMVIDHLGLPDWQRYTLTTELDVLGPFATTALSRHGLLWPFNTHMHMPIIADAAGGSVVTGFGGDELGRSSQGKRAAQVFARTRRPHPVDALVVGLALSPRPLRRRVIRHRMQPQVEALPWLTSLGVQSVLGATVADEVAIPMGWPRTICEWIPRSRYFRICKASFQILGDSYGVQVVHPFADERVLEALAREAGFAGMGTRTQLMRHLFGDVLPADLVQRQTKAGFNGVLFTDISRDFAASWSGHGVPEELVDPQRLRRHWLDGPVDAKTFTMLQAAWLHDNPSGRR